MSDDGIVYSFGQNNYGQSGHFNNPSSDEKLGEGQENISLPTPIQNLPKIKLVACGAHFTVCVDFEGFIWAFGENNVGQLGTGKTTRFNVPQKILNIPPVLSVSCGAFHTLIITNDSNLWSCGDNSYGQLCLENRKDQSTFQQTSFSNTLQISCGGYFSLFQIETGEIYLWI